jgi:sugar phosphate isomerase/epimerase
MKYSVFSVATPEWTPEQAAHELADLGYDGIAWRITDQQTADVPDFWIGNKSTWPLTGLEESLPLMRQLADETGIEIAALYGYAGWSDRSALDRFLAAGAELGVATCRFVGSGSKTKSGPRPQLGRAPYDDLFDETRRDFAWIANRAAHYGVRAVTPLHHEWVNSSASAARRLLADLDPAAIGIIADYGHLAIEGAEDTLAGLQILGPYLDSVMLKNFSWVATVTRDDGTVVWEYVPSTLREGRVDIPNVMAALNAVGFDGWITIAEVAGDLPQKERLADALAYVKTAERRSAGATVDDWSYEYHKTGALWKGLL